MILQAFKGADEVDEGHLGRYLWQVVRILQLGGDEELEVVRVLQYAVSELDSLPSGILGVLEVEQRLQQWIECLTNSFEEHRKAELNAVLESSCQICSSWLEHDEPRCLRSLLSLSFSTCR